MFEDILRLTLAEADGGRAMIDLVKRWTIDRLFSFRGMLESCRYDVEKMKEYGFDDARVEKFPADGRSTFGYWRMPYAWDPVDAKLTIVSPASQAGKVLAHYASLPCSLTMWSPPTPKKGVQGEVVALERGDRDEDYAGLRVKGKFVLTNLRGEAVRGQAVRRGAIGLISDVCRHPYEMPDAVDWMNAWSEDPCGWGLTRGERNLIGFNISHRAGRELRKLMETDGRVRLHAVVDAKIYEGVMPVATGLVRGRTSEEVLTLGHGAEQGAVDNSSGCACMLEALRVIAELVRSGKLPRPRRGIRMLITWEIYATLAFVEKHRGRIARTVAGLCLDSVAVRRGIPGAPPVLYRNPASNAAFTDTFMKLLAESLWTNRRSDRPWLDRDFGMTDNVIADASIGVPTAWLGTAEHRYWHTNEDTPEQVDAEALREVSAYTATYLYFLANAGEAEAAWLAAAAAADHRGKMARAGFELACVLRDATGAGDLAAKLAAARERVGFLHALARTSVDSVRRLAPGRKGRAGRAVEEAKTLVNHAAYAEYHSLEGAASAVAAERGWKPVEPPVEDDAETTQAAKMIVARTRIGPIAFDGIPLAKRRGLDDSRWGSPLMTVLFWCDGRRTLAEAVKLASQETTRKLSGIVWQIRKCAKLGLVTIRRA